MMLSLISDGRYALFIFLVIALIISLTFHEWGHAKVAWMFGDDTAKKRGRLTLNPAAHIDPVGLLMVMVIGFGYAKPVPTNPNNFTSRSADLWVAAAGPFMNFVLAVVVWNVYLIAAKMGFGWAANEGVAQFCFVLAQINLLLMVFNLIPLGPLDGHYIFPYLLPEGLRAPYRYLNQTYGSWLFIGLIVLSVMGVPIFRYVSQISSAMLGWISIL